MTTRIAIPLSVALLTSCATAPQPETPTSATPAADPAPERSPAEVGPLYKPSSSAPKPLPIASNEYGAYAGAPDAPEIGDIAESFELPTIDGGTFSLDEARKAGPVLIMFYRGFW